MKPWDMHAEPNKAKPIQIEDLHGIIKSEFPVDVAEVNALFDAIVGRLTALYGRVSGALPSGASDEDREWRQVNRQSQVEQTLNALCREAIIRYRQK